MRKLAAVLLMLALCGTILPGCCKDTEWGFFCIILIPFIGAPDGAPSDPPAGPGGSPSGASRPSRCSPGPR